ncbi:glycosyltransferase family 4 protein [Pseudomonas sp. NPDC078700]|uniref:glycosyltransferase family 4 protein n=1 Tax=Pseudomonas sp. NPDC078700 TaxID=3364424 RepID=UPI0037CACFA3
MIIWWILPAVTLLTLVLTDVLRRYALSKRLIDIPNARSSHSVPTPRGGGLAVVIIYLTVLPVLFFIGLVTFSSMLALFVTGAVIAIIGFVDDHGHIAARWRLLGHIVAAVWAVFWLGGLPPIAIAGFTVSSGFITSCIAVFYLVWMLNLYNFMDGIDGLASLEAVTVCVGGAVIYWCLDELSYVYLPLTLAGAVAGFLFWNFPPAKIFMGDAGSGFLGITLGILSIQAAWVAPQLLWSWLILLGVFIVDATFTLLRRLLRGDKVYEAHRSHGYQYAARHYKSHLPVSLGVTAINIVWLFPLALLVALGHMSGFWAMLLAYAPLVFLAVKFSAGSIEPQNS